MTDKPAGEPDQRASASPERPADRRVLLRVGVVTLAAAVALVAWLATRDDDGGPSQPATAAEAAPRVVSAAELADVDADLSQAVYWAGPVPGTELVLKELGRGGVQVSYPPEGTDPAAVPAGVLTIGSYPLADPASAVEGFAGRPGGIVRHRDDGAEVVSSEESPTSAYFASPDNSVQIEVYDPSPKRAMGLALSGKVRPVD